jgi:Protein of unknown function (DUF2794)
LSDIEPIQFRRPANTSSSGPSASPAQQAQPVTAFNRQELSAILNVYGRQVAAGEWRDYSIEFTRDSACFSVYRRTSEVPLYRIEKSPKLARKQGAYSVIAATGLILKRGQELAQVLSVFDKKVRLVGGH